MSTLEDFKIIFSSRMINQLINSGTPPSKYWEIPESFQKNPTIMEALMSKNGYDIYLSLSEDDRMLAIKFIENFGSYLNEIIDCPVFENWDKQPIKLSDEKVNILKEKYNLKI